MKTISRGGLVACLLLLGLILCTPVNQSHAGKPKPPPPLPPVRYAIQFWDLPNPGNDGTDPNINDMNNLGQIVGWYFDPLGDQRAYLYHPEWDLAVDLEAAYGGAGVPPGWKVASAVGINYHGVIVGYLAPIGSPYGGGGSRRGFRIDTTAAQRVFEVLDFDLGDDEYARQINDNGDILGAYHNPNGPSGIYLYCANDPNPLKTLDGVQATAYLNNPAGTRPAQVGGTFDDGTQKPFRWTPQTSSTPQTFGSFATYGGVRGINDSGTLCGSASTGRPAKITPFRLDGSATFLSSDFGPWGQAINSTGDVLLAPAGTLVGGIYRDDWSAYGYYADINKLVVGTPAELTEWSHATSLALYEMNDRGASLGGQIAGYLRFSDGSTQPFLLTAVAP